MIVALPPATEVTRPVDDTVAMEALEVVHVTVAPDITAQRASITVAVSCCVDPTVVNERLVGDSVICAAT